MPTSLRDALRALRGARGTTVLAFLILTLAIAASTVTFSVVDNVVLRRLPYPGDDRLIAISIIASRTGRPQAVTPQDFFGWLDHQTTCEELAASGPWTLRIHTADRLENLRARRATPNLFKVLGVAPLLGQFFGPQHQVTGQDAVVVLTHEAWLQRFGGDPSVIGRAMTFGNEIRTVLGVLPPGFEYPAGLEQPTQAFVPWVPRADDRDRAAPGRSYFLSVVGRLKPDVAIAQARAQIEKITASQTAPSELNLDRGPRVVVTLLREFVVGRVGPWMRLLLGAVGLVLLVACANVANLLLARSTVRARELALRTALGASRSRLARTVCLESILLAATSAAAGLVIAWWGLGIVKAALPANIARASSISLDLRVLTVAVTAALMTGLIFGAVPAWHASRADIVTILKSGNPAIGGSARARWQRAFLALELSFVVTLLVGTGLFVMSFIRIVTMDLGFDRRSLVAFDVSKSFMSLNDEAQPVQQTALARDIVDRVRQVPGVAAVGGISGGVPFGGSVQYNITVPGVFDLTAGQMADLRGVTSEYLQTAGVRLLRGRLFDENDRPGSPPVAIINDVAAKRLFDHQEAIGQTVAIRGRNTVVGVVQAVRLGGPEVDLRSEVYVPFWPISRLHVGSGCPGQRPGGVGRSRDSAGH